MKHYLTHLLLSLLFCGLFDGTVAPADETTTTASQSVQVTVSSSSTQDSDESEPNKTVSGKIVVVGPDGERKEYDLGDKLPDNLRLNINDLTKGIVISGEDLLTGKDTPRFMIGVMCQPASKVLRSHLKLGEKGIVVTNVSRDMPAALAGVEVGDILIGAGDKEFRNTADLVAAVADCHGEAITIRRIHSGDVSEVQLTPQKATNSDAIAALMQGAAEISTDDVHGMMQQNRRALEALSKNLQNSTIHSFGPAIELDDAEAFEGDFSKMLGRARKQAIDNARGMHSDRENKAKLNAQLEKLKKRVEELEQRLEAAETPQTD